MALFGLGSSKPPKPDPARDERLAAAVYEAACSYVDEGGGRIRVEDLISALAAVAGETCLAAAGQVKVAAHDYAPGSLVFSDKVNQLLCGDARAWDQVPAGSVFGAIRQGALAAGYPADAFPALEAVFQVLPQGLGAAPWGFVPLSTDAAHIPRQMPLRAAFELRERVGAIWAEAPVSNHPTQSALAMLKALVAVREAIDAGTVLRLALETINGMAKTAPFNAAHFAQMETDAK